MSFHSATAARGFLAGSALALGCAPCPVMAQEAEGIVVTDRQAPLQDSDPYVASDEALRLEKIGFRLASSNADKCAAPEMLSGMIVHDISDYNAAVRPEIVRKSNISYGFAILAILPASPAERAGLAIADEIVGIDGMNLRDAAFDHLPATASYSRIEAFTTSLSAAMQRGPAQLEVLRGGKTISLSMTGVPGCGGRMSLQQGKQLNAWSDGRYVAVTSRMMNFAKNDDELAFVIAHEMAHNIKNHAQELKSRSALLASLGWGAGKFYKTEAEADDFAVSLLASAGFDLKGPGRLLGHFSNFSLLYLSPTHPTFGRRLEIVSRAIEALAQPKVQLSGTSPILAQSGPETSSSFGCILKDLRAFPTVRCHGLTPASTPFSLTLPPIRLASARLRPLALPAIDDRKVPHDLAETSRSVAQSATGWLTIQNLAWSDRATDLK